MNGLQRVREKVYLVRHAGFALLVAALLLGPAVTPAGAVDLLEGRLKINGFVQSTNILRCQNFDIRCNEDGSLFGPQDDGLVRQKNEAQIELQLDAINNWGPLSNATFFGIVNGWYDSAFALNDNFGENSGSKVGPNDFISQAAGLKRQKTIGNDNIVLPFPGDPGDLKRTLTDDADRFLAFYTDDDINDETDVATFVKLREAYVDLSFNDLVGDNDLFVRAGRQQISWGKTDFFRLLDVVNPVDFGNHFFLEPFEDFKIPQTMVSATWKFNRTGPFDDLSLELDWNPNKYTPAQLGLPGGPFRFPGGADQIAAFSLINTAFGAGLPNGTGLSDVDLPGDGVFNDSQYGGRLQGVYKGLTWSANAWYGWSDFPVFQLREVQPGGVNYKIVVPRKLILGGSLDYFEELTDSVWRLEFAWSNSESFTDTLAPDGTSKSDVFRWVLGWDRPTFIPFLNPNRTFILTAQVFGTHVPDANERSVVNAFGNKIKNAGFAGTEQNTYVFTFVALGFYHSDRIQPVVFATYDTAGEGGLAGANVTYLLTNNFDVNVGINTFYGKAQTSDTGPLANVAQPGCPATIGPAQIKAQPQCTAGFVRFRDELPFGAFREGAGQLRGADEVTLRFRFRF